jgi:uncharacterized membrane protein YjjP (DUF1212 family)
MTVMWTASSFSSYLLTFMNKYLEGSIYVNHYYEAVASVIACIIGAKLYSRIGIRFSFLLAFSLTLIFGTCIYLLESGMVSLPPRFID